MAKCAECAVKMGYTESNVARDHNGMCVACHVKSLVKEKVDAANKPNRPTNVKSIDNLFNKFEGMLITSETAVNFRVRKRLGVVHGEGLFVVRDQSFLKRFFLRVFRKKERIFEKSLKSAINEAIVELKASALRAGANAVLGYDIQYTNVTFNSREHVIVSASGTAVEMP